MPNEPISATPRLATMSTQSLCSTQVPPTWPTDAEIPVALGPWMLQRRWFPLKGSAAPPPDSLRVTVSQEPEEGVRDLVIAALRGNQAKTGHRNGMVSLHVPVVPEFAEVLDPFATPDEAPSNHGLLVTTDPPGPPTQVTFTDGIHHLTFRWTWALSALEVGAVPGEAGALTIAQRAPRLRVTTGGQFSTSAIPPTPSDLAEALGEQDAVTGNLIVKFLRVLEHGHNPGVELSVAPAHSDWGRMHTPAAWSAIAWTRMGGCGQPALEESTGSVVACSFVPRVDNSFELFCLLASTDDVDGPVRTRAVELARDLGHTTAQMRHHLVVPLDTSRSPTPTGPIAFLRKRTRQVLEEVPELSGHVRTLELKVEWTMEWLEALGALEPATRIHGDYRLGQVFYEIGGQQRWYVLDFESEPLCPLAQCSDSDLPARGVAGMLRSFDYAVTVGRVPHSNWFPVMRSAFEKGYCLGRRKTNSLTPSPAVSGDQEQVEASCQTVLTYLKPDKALYKAIYEVRSRFDWLGIPLVGIESVLSRHAED